jgi:ribonuclease HI
MYDNFNGVRDKITLNAAEYLAVIKLLNKAKALNVSNLQIYSSNKLVVEQMNKLMTHK